MRDTNILVWLPSPMGDAILCTPALRAIRQRFVSGRISFFADPVVRQVLSPGSFNDGWLQPETNNPFAIAKKLKEHKFTHAVLLKNSFASALSAFWARIPCRIGYARQGRGFLLTDKLYPPRLPTGKFKPISMIDYYLAIACWLGADATERNLQLLVEPQQKKSLREKLPELFGTDKPIIILVPGGAFGPSKCWSSERFAQTADWLISNYNSIVVVSVSPDPFERKIASQICTLSRYKLVNLAEKPVTLGELKALFSMAELVVSNDTGPRHMATALGRKVVTLLGPNAPAWTDTNYENEIQIIADVPCAPCAEPVCKRSEHLCMQAITVQMVCSAAKELLEGNRRQSIIMAPPEFIETSKSFFVACGYEKAFRKLGLTSMEGVFTFNAGINLTKDRLASYRSRWKFEINSSSTALFLKRYNKPPILGQLKNWASAHRRVSCGLFDLQPTRALAAAGIKTAKIISYGQQWGSFFEERSFIITEEIAGAESIERKLPDYFDGPVTAENLRLRRDFIARLGRFISRFHHTGYCHRDLYFSHIFYSDDGGFYLIDLARAFKPALWRQRFWIKDIAQLHYSAAAKYFSNADRLRFYLSYTGGKKLSGKDKVFIRKVIKKTRRMARHDKRHGRMGPFADGKVWVTIL